MNTIIENIPQELKNLNQWIITDSSKIPKDAKTGQNAKANDKSTWSDFETALKGMERFGYCYLGFEFDNGYFGVDLDKCLDNQDFIEEFVETLQSYTEISRSGNGIHIICKGTLPNGAKRRGNVEMYSDKRYFIITGNLYNPNYTEIKDCTETIKPLHSKYLSEQIPQVAPKRFEIVNLDDSEILEKARSCKTGSLFQLLYSGQWQGIYNSQSDADLSLCNHLAFWTQKNKDQMDRIFRTSGLYRKKWDEKRGAYTYGDMTLEKAIAGCGEVYEPTQKSNDTSIAIGVFGKGNKPTQTQVKLYDATDTGNAQRFHDKYVGNIKYSYVNKYWYFWDGKKWCKDQTGEIKKLADNIVDDLKKDAFLDNDPESQQEKLKWAYHTASSKAKESMIKETQHLEDIPILPDEMDSYKDFINSQSGIINLRNRELIPHESSFNMSRISYSEYNQSQAKPTLWLSFLNDVLQGDQDLIRYVQKAVGYSLTGSVREQCAFFLYGMGNNGKSTFMDTISNLLGTYSANIQPETIMMKKNDSNANSDIARLKGVRFVSCEEATEGIRLNEGLLKQLTGGGKITCRFLYGDDFEYEPEFKIWMATNHKPRIIGTDEGIWRRIRMIPFEVSIPKEKVDKSLKYKLRNELPLIMNWAVEGCLLWQKEGLEPPQKVLDATSEYKTENDLLSTFIESCITIDYNATIGIPANDLFALYSSWATKNNEYVMTSRKFYGDITKKLPEKVRKGDGIYFNSIKIKDTAKSLLTSSVGYKASDFYKG